TASPSPDRSTPSLHDALPIWLRGARGHPLPRNGDEVVKQGLRQQVILPADFRMPLDSEDELIGSSVDDRFDYPVGRPGNRLEVRSEEHTSELQSRVDLVCRLL